MTLRILIGDTREKLKELPDESVHLVCTSPPYFGLRDYGMAGQIGLEPTPDAYVAELVAVFREVHRVLRKEGTVFLNLGDSYASGAKGSGGTGKSGLRSDGREETLRIKSADESNGRAKFDIRRFDLEVSGLKPKDLIGIPWRVAFALQADGWYLRQDIIWAKPNPMPESVRDRCTKSHEYLFLLAKSRNYYYDAEAVAEAVAESSVERLNQSNIEAQRGSDRVPGKTNGPMKAVGTTSTRNRRSVWTIATQPNGLAHFALMPDALAELCIKAGCPSLGTVLDPFGGAGTTGIVADRLQRNAILIELNPEYAAMAEKRIYNDAPLFAEAAE